MLTRDQIFAVSDSQTKKVNVPEWNGPVFVKTMTAGERDAFESEHIKNPNDNIRARLAAATVCDEQGNLLFTAADIPALSKKSAAALDRIFTAAIRLNRISREDVAELEGNS